MNAFLCLAGGVLFAAGIGGISKVINCCGFDTDHWRQKRIHGV